MGWTLFSLYFLDWIIERNENVALAGNVFVLQSWCRVVVSHHR